MGLSALFLTERQGIQRGRTPRIEGSERQKMTYHSLSTRRPPTTAQRQPVEKHKTYYIKDGTQWWDEYEQQEAIIIDDFDGKWPFRDLLRLLDRYPYQGQFKGGYVPINSPFIYITCEHPPDWFWGPMAKAPLTGDRSANELAQMLRRIDEIVHVEDMAKKAVEAAVIDNHFVIV